MPHVAITCTEVDRLSKVPLQRALEAGTSQQPGAQLLPEGRRLGAWHGAEVHGSNTSLLQLIRCILELIQAVVLRISERSRAHGVGSQGVLALSIIGVQEVLDMVRVESHEGLVHANAHLLRHA